MGRLSSANAIILLILLSVLFLCAAVTRADDVPGQVPGIEYPDIDIGDIDIGS